MITDLIVGLIVSIIGIYTASKMRNYESLEACESFTDRRVQIIQLGSVFLRGLIKVTSSSDWGINLFALLSVQTTRLHNNSAAWWISFTSAWFDFLCCYCICREWDCFCPKRGVAKGACSEWHIASLMYAYKIGRIYKVASMCWILQSECKTQLDSCRLVTW